jgi:hypothetical protein
MDCHVMLWDEFAERKAAFLAKDLPSQSSTDAKSLTRELSSSTSSCSIM